MLKTREKAYQLQPRVFHDRHSALSLLKTCHHNYMYLIFRLATSATCFIQHCSYVNVLINEVTTFVHIPISSRRSR